MKNGNQVILLSGGLDSTALLFKILHEGKQYQNPITVSALGFDYGQRHKRELKAAEEIAALAGVHYQTIDLSSLRTLLKGSSQTDESVAVPHGHFADETMKLTIVPNRNMVMVAIAAAYAQSIGAAAVSVAAHAGDHFIYPDCRPEFFRHLAEALISATDGAVTVLSPFSDKTKAEIVQIGTIAGAPFHLTWSCYEGGQYHCGKCGTCYERREAFQLAGIADPTVYQEA